MKGLSVFKIFSALKWTRTVYHCLPIYFTNEKVQPSTKHTYKTKDRVTRTPLKAGGELRCSGNVNISCSTSDTGRVNLYTNTVISHERGKDREVFTTSGTYRGHL